MGTRSSTSITVNIGLVSLGLKLYTIATVKDTKLSNPKTDPTAAKSETQPKLKTDKATVAEVKTKTFEWPKGTTNTFTEEEIESLEGDDANTLSISEFIPVSEIDTFHIEKSYYTSPELGMDKEYKLLYKTLVNLGSAAVGTMIHTTKERLVTIVPYNGSLILSYMFYDSELHNCDERCADVVLSDNELRLFGELVGSLHHQTFDRSKYRDKFIDKITAACKLKQEGKAVTKRSINKTNKTDTETAIKMSLKKVS
jgi:Ku protein